MKCCVCKGNIASGAEAQKMIVEYVQSDGTAKVFGYQMPNGPLSAATGQLVRAWHHKHYHVQRKREQRGDAVTGRVLAGGPTAYQIHDLVLSRDEFEALGLTEAEARAQGTGSLTDRLTRLRAVATRLRKAIGDATVVEAFHAAEHGGPYEHSHQFRMDDYQLRAHIHFAHGHADNPMGYGYTGTWQDYHAELHASSALSQTIARRRDDPGHVEPVESDWREQVAVDIEELR